MSQKAIGYHRQGGKKGKLIMLMTRNLERTCLSGTCPQDMNQTASVALQHNIGPREKS